MCLILLILLFLYYCLVWLLVQKRLQCVSSHIMSLHTHESVQRTPRLLEVEFLDQSVYAIIILTDTGNMHSIENVSLRAC